MKNITGSLRVANGKWRIIISYYDETGKRRQKTISTGLDERGNKKQAQKMLDEYLEQNGDDTTILLSDIYVADYLQEWFDGMEGEVRGNTYKNYRYTFNAHILPYFKAHNKLLKDLTQRDIKKYYKEKLKTLSVVTVKKHHANIHKALDEAVEDGLIKYNPATGIKFPKKKKFVGQFYNEEEIKTLKKLVKGTTIEVPVMLTIFYGLRRSEVLGLKWDAVDFNLNRIHVRHTIIDVDDGDEGIDDTKSDSSKRYLPMSEEIKTYFKSVKKHQLERKMFYGNAYVDSGYVCTYDNGELMRLNYLTQKYHELMLDNADKIKTIRFHDLRHSAATILLSLGFSLYDIKEWLGHSDISTTMIYAHYVDEKKEEMMAKLSDRVG